MSQLPSGLDAGGVAALATVLHAHARTCRDTAAGVMEVRDRAATWWTGDAADRYKHHAEWRCKALDAMAEATTTAAEAARVYAEAIAAAFVAHDEAEANLRISESYGNVAAAWRWERRRAEVVEVLEDAAEAFAAAVNDRFSADTAWWGLFDDRDDLDALAERRDAALLDWDRMLERHSAELTRWGLVDGVPDRIPRRPDDPTTLATSSEQSSGAVGVTFGPSSETKVGLKFGGTATVKQYENGVVEIELDTRGGAIFTVRGVDGEASRGLVHRYLFPDASTARAFMDGLERLNTGWEQRRNPRGLQFEAMQFDDQFGRYRTAVVDTTGLKAGTDRPVTDREVSGTWGDETDPRNGDRTTIAKIEGKSRSNNGGLGLGVEVDAEIRSTTSRSGEPRQLEITFSGHSKVGAVIETDTLRQFGDSQDPRTSRVLDQVKAGSEEYTGRYGRINVKVDLSTPDGREIAARLREAAEQGRMPDAETLRRAKENGTVRVEAGTFTESTGKVEVAPTRRTPGVLVEGANRSYRRVYPAPGQ